MTPFRARARDPLPAIREPQAVECPASAAPDSRARPGTPSPARRLLAIAPLLLLWCACSGEPVLHGLDERRANQAAVALDEGGIHSRVRREEGGEAGFAVLVPGADTARARRLLAERELPRPDPGGFAAAFKPGLVPTPAEERARFLQALAGELSRTVEAVEGVVEARVHLALPPDDPFRGGAFPAPRGAVLVKVLPGARPRLEELAPGIRALVAGAVAGLDPAQVAVVLTDAPAGTPAPCAPPFRPGLLALAAGVGAAALALLFAPLALRGRLPWKRPGQTR